MKEIMSAKRVARLKTRTGSCTSEFKSGVGDSDAAVLKN
jgi:hypothetical protein